MQYSIIYHSYHAVYPFSMTCSFYNWIFVPFNLLLIFTCPPMPASGNHQPVLYIHIHEIRVLFVHFCFLIPPISDIVWYLFFSLWLISLCVIPFRSFHAIANGKISFFFGWKMFHFVYGGEQSLISLHLLMVPALAAVNGTVVNMRVHASIEISVFCFLCTNIQKWNCWVIQ